MRTSKVITRPFEPPRLYSPTMFLSLHSIGFRPKTLQNTRQHLALSVSPKLCVRRGGAHRGGGRGCVFKGWEGASLHLCASGRYVSRTLAALLMMPTMAVACGEGGGASELTL